MNVPFWLPVGMLLGPLVSRVTAASDYITFPLKIGIMIEPPFVDYLKGGKRPPRDSQCHTDEDTGEVYCGYLIDLMNEYKKSINFDPRVRLFDGKGGAESNQEDLIEALKRGELDAVFAPIPITAELRESVNFSKPFMDADLSIMMKFPTSGQPLKRDAIKKLRLEDYFIKTNSFLFKWWTRNQEKRAIANQVDLETPINEILDRIGKEDKVYLEESPRAVYTASRRPDCDIYVIDTESMSSYALAFRNDFPIDHPRTFEQFDDDMMQFKENGILDMLYDRWWVDGESSRCRTPTFNICGDPAANQNSSDHGCEAPRNENLFKIHYRVIMHLNVFPFTFIDSCSDGIISGYSVDLINDLEQRIGFVKHLESAKTDSTTTDPFSGMINSLEEARGQIATGPFTIPQDNVTDGPQVTSLYRNRSKLVKFSYPIMKNVRIGALALKSNQLINNLNWNQVVGPHLGVKAKIIMINNSYVNRYILESGDNDLKSLVDNAEFVDGLTAAIRKTREPGHIWIDEYPFLAAFAAKDFSLAAAESPILLGDYAFALQKEDRSICQVNAHLETMERTSILLARYRKYWEPFDQAFCLDFMH